MKKWVLSFFTALFCLLVLAQEGGGDGGEKKVNINVTTDNDGGNWYASPWVWVVGAAVFILLLVALTRGGGRRSD